MISGPVAASLANADDYKNEDNPYHRYTISTRSGGVLQTICPDHPGFQHGTYVLKLFCKIGGLYGDGQSCETSVWFSIDALPEPAASAPAACTLPPGVNSSTHHCLRDGERWNDAVNVPGWPDTIGIQWFYFAYLIQPNPDATQPTTFLISTSMHGYSSFVNQFPVILGDPGVDQNTPWIESYSNHDTQSGSNCFAPDVCPAFIDLIDGYSLENYISLYITSPTWLYFAVLDLDENPWIMIESRTSEVWKRSFSVPLTQYHTVMYGLVSIHMGQVWCHDDAKRGVQYQHPYQFDQSNSNSEGGSMFWWPLPSYDPNPFYPQVAFAWVSGSALIGRDITFDRNNTALANHLNFVVVAKFYPNGLGVEVSRLDGKLSNTLNCQLDLHGNLAGGEPWTYGNVPSNVSESLAAYPNSQYNLFNNWDDVPGIGNFSEKTISEAAEKAPPVDLYLARIAQLLEETVTASGSRLLDINFQLQLIRFSLPIANLLQTVSGTYEVKNVTVPEVSDVCHAVPGSTDFLDDSCCNLTLGYSGETCVPRAQNVVADGYDRLAPDASTCGDRNCFDTYVQDVASSVQSSKLGTCARITENLNTFEYKYYSAFANCRDMYLGLITEEPSHCSSDADCSAYGVKCNMARRQCLVPIAERFRNFTQCFLNTADRLLMIQLAKNVFNRDPAADPTLLTDVDLWYNNYITTQECSDPAVVEWAIPGRSHYYMSSAFLNFDYCNPSTTGTYSGFDPYPWVPWQCQKYQLGVASFLRQSSDAGSCTGLTTCNWFRDFGAINSNITQAEDTCLNHYNNISMFCGVTDNGFDYYPVDVNQTVCQTAGKVACFHNDGTVTVENSQAICEGYSSCSTPGGTINNCQTTLGECTSPIATQPRPFLVKSVNNVSTVLSLHAYSTATTNYIFNLEKPGLDTFYKDGLYTVPGTGACFSPWAIPPVGFTCGTAVQSANQRASILGCVNFDLTTQVACLNNNPNNLWLVNPTNQTTCESMAAVPQPGGTPSDHDCERPLDSSVVAFYFQHAPIHTDQPRTSCEATPGGVWKQRLTWKPATWRASTSRPLVWAQAKYGPRFSYGINNTAAVDTLVADVLKAIGDIYIFEQKSTIFCEYGRLNTALNAIDCLCSSNGTATCESGASSSAVSTACGGAAGTAFVPPAALGFFTNTVYPPGGCVNFEVQIVSHINYRTTQPEGVPSYFIDFSEKAEYSFRNDNGALIGQIVGDGLVISVSGTPTGYINDVSKVCMRVASDIPINYPDLYTLYGWATAGPIVAGVKTFNLIDSVNTTFNSDSGEVCGVFKIVPTETYFPIILAQDQASLQPNIFKKAEFGLIIVLIIAYIFMIGLILFKLRYIITIRAFPFSAGVTIPLFGLYAVRLIYFSMLIAYQFVTDTGGLGPWVLVELPLLLYFATTIYFVLNWAFVTRTIKKLGKARRIQALTIRYFAIVMVILLLIFIAFLLCFALLRPSPVYSCSGRIVTIDDAVPKAIAIGYRVWMGALCAFVGIAFVSYATFILAAMAQVTSRGGNDKIAAQRERAKKNLTFMAIACATSLFIEAVYMLVLAFYTSNRDALNIASLVIMLITEVTPGVGILVMLDLSELAKTAELTRTQSRMAGASRGGSTATRGTGLKSMADAVANTSTETGENAPGSTATKSASSVSASATD